MITHDNVVNFLKNSLTTYFNTVSDGKYSDFVDRMDVFEEGSYNSNKDIIVTVQFLKGTTQLGFTDLPINVIFEVIEGKATNDKTIANQVMDLVNSFIEDFNDTTTQMYDEDNLEYDDATDTYSEEVTNTPYIVTQYYSSTASIGNGQQRGTNKYKAFTMDMRLLIYESGYYQTLEDHKITFTNFIDSNDNNTTKTMDLANVLEITSHISKAQEGFTLGSNPNQKLRLSGISYQIQVTYIATKKNALHVHLADNALESIAYNVTHEGFSTRTASMEVIDYVESTPYADTMKVQLTLARR